MEPRSDFHLSISGYSHRLTVLSFVARDRLSKCYEVDIEITSEDAHADLARELMGRRGLFAVDCADPTTVFHGVVGEVELSGVVHIGDRSEARYRVRLVPQLWLLTQRRRSRVYQGKHVGEVIQEVLAEVDIRPLWMLSQALPKRDYITQLEETDEAFVRRLAAEAGLFFFFLQPPPPAPVLADVLAGVGAVLDVAAGALGAVPGAGDAAGVLGGLGGAAGSVLGEVIVFADSAVAYHGIGDLPPELDSLMRSGLGQLDQLTGGALGQATAVAGAVGGLVGQLGGPDLSSWMSLGNSRTLHYRPDGDALRDDRDAVREIRVRDAVRTDRAVFSAYDPRRPLANLRFEEPPQHGVVGQAASALGLDIPGEVLEVAGKAAEALGRLGGEVGELGHLIGGVLGEGDFEHYEHHDPFILPSWEDARHQPKRVLEACRADRRVASGVSPCPLLSCGARFTLADHPVDWVNREYAVVEVTHRGDSGRLARGDGHTPLSYENTFSCVPSDVPFRPPRPARRIAQTCLTATVIGEGGQDTDLCTRDMGEIKVRFHWDREGRGTCWVRTMQAWAGAGWGAQHMPRVGMEVVVGFDGGDPDKPIVLGCLYNGTHPPPYALPEHQTRSGFRSQSTPGHAGFNELSFEDRTGQEQIYLHAQRNLDARVEHDESSYVGHDHHRRVVHDQQLVVENEQRLRIEGGQRIFVRSERRVEVEGTQELVTRGRRVESVHGDAEVHVSGNLDERIEGSRFERVEGDALRRAGGSTTELVGSHDSPGSRSVRVEGNSQLSASGTNHIVAEGELVLQCGQSLIVVTDGRIQLSSPEILIGAEGATVRLGSGDIKLLADGKLQAVANEIILAGAGATLGLTSEASLDGSQVLLNSPQNASDSVEPEEVTPTVIELTDQDGEPIPYQRFRVQLDDGSVVGGVLDANGRAEVVLDGSGQVEFPDLANVEAT